MNITDPILLSDDEQSAMEREWNSGFLRHHVDCLMRFVRHHHEEILRVAGGPDAGTDRLVSAVRGTVIQHRCIHPLSEMQAQMAEINKELWYHGEKGDHDRARIEEEWTRHHAAGWRVWRLKQYLYIAGRCPEQIAREINAAATPPHAGGPDGCHPAA